MVVLVLCVNIILFTCRELSVKCFQTNIAYGSSHKYFQAEQDARKLRSSTQTIQMLDREKTRIPNFKTLVEAGNIFHFENQFRIFENLNRKENDGGRERTLSVAERVLKDLDTKVNPCDNFYQFACGGFLKGNGRLNDWTNIYIRSSAQKISQIVKTELQRNFMKSDPAPLRKAKRFFRSCMDEKTIERRGVSPLLKFLSDRGGWPVLGSWDYQKFDFIDLLARTRPLLKDYEFHYMPSGAIIGMLIQRDFGKKGQYAIYLDQSNLGQFSIGGFPNQEVYRLGKSSIYNKAYLEYLIDIAVLLGADPEVAEKDMRDVVRFETELANIMLFEEDRRRVDIRYNKISILEMSMKYPKINWLRFLRKVLATANIQIDFSNRIILWASPYFDKLEKIIACTSKRTLANYILFRAIQPLLPSVNKQMQYITLRYTAVVNGEFEPRLPERADFCTSVVRGQMDWVTSRIYVENSLYGNTIEYTNKITDYIRSVSIDMIKKAVWLSDTTKENVVKKMKSIRDKIGFPTELLGKTFLENYYRNFHIGNYFFENMEEALTENYRIVLSKLVHPPSDEWLVRPDIVTAWHNLGTTSIEISLGILDEPFFSKDYPPSMNFGGIDVVIGHEYGHGFEVTGMKFDINGLIRRYWSDISMRNFAKRADCFVNQYSRYFIPEADLFILNGNKTLNENIPDNIGSVAAFYAYRKWKRAKNINDNVPGLPFTGEQLYFINMARTWCGSNSPVFLRKFPLLEHHALNILRVIGPLQNMPEFSSAFQCPLGSFMNPVKKCRFW